VQRGWVERQCTPASFDAMADTENPLTSTALQPHDAATKRGEAMQRKTGGILLASSKA